MMSIFRPRRHWWGLKALVILNFFRHLILVDFNIINDDYGVLGFWGQNGLWVADATTIAALQSFDTDKVILIDTHNRPVEVDRLSLLNKLKTVYQETMSLYLAEFKETENKR